MPKYLLQPEDKGEYVSEHATLQLAKDAAAELGFDVQWQDHPRGERGKFAKVFKGVTHRHPIAVAYPSIERTMWIWYDPTP